MVVGIRRVLEKGREREGLDVEGVIKKRVNLWGREWKVVGVYINGDLEEKLKEVDGWVEDVEGEDNSRRGF